MAIENVKDAASGNHKLKTQTYCVELEIQGNATPANKVQSVDIPTVILRTEGKTAEADAVEDLSADFTTPVDASGIFGILLESDKLANNGVKKVLDVRLRELKTSAATSIAISDPVTDFLSPEGNIAIDVTATGLDLTSETTKMVLEVCFLEA